MPGRYWMLGRYIYIEYDDIVWPIVICCGFEPNDFYHDGDGNDDGGGGWRCPAVPQVFCALPALCDTQRALFVKRSKGWVLNKQKSTRSRCTSQQSLPSMKMGDLETALWHLGGGITSENLEPDGLCDWGVNLGLNISVANMWTLLLHVILGLGQSCNIICAG